jgi:hypothetical protein
LVGPGAVLDAVAKRKIPNPRRESKPETPIVQPVGQRYTGVLKVNTGYVFMAWCLVKYRDNYCLPFTAGTTLVIIADS